MNEIDNLYKNIDKAITERCGEVRLYSYENLKNFENEIKSVLEKKANLNDMTSILNCKADVNLTTLALQSKVKINN